VFDFLAQRVAISVVTLFLITLIVFTGVRMIPGDPARVMAGTDADEAGLQEVRAKYGLNDPIPVQYFRWIALALRGDLGESIRTREPVVKTVAIKLPITMQLAGFSLLIAIGIAIPAGVFSAVRRNTVWDLAANAVSLCGVSIPSFWLGIMLILFLSVRLHLLPASGFVPFFQDPLGNLQRMLMPAFVLGASLAAVLMRQTRNSMIEVMSANYIRTAYSKGLMGGAVVTEQIFVVPGFGRLIVEAVFTRDYPLVQGVVLITASTYVLINLLVDVSYSLLNPRLRVKGSAGGS
jgi:peptide/nickel transport system permease protein